MPTKPSPAAERIMALKVGKSCVVTGKANRQIVTARKHMPGAEFSYRTVDGQAVVTRTA